MSCRIVALILALAFGIVQHQFLGMHGSLANGVNCRIDHRNVDKEMEGEFPAYMLDISC